jgi:hypothetical protein
VRVLLGESKSYESSQARALSIILRSDRVKNPILKSSLRICAEGLIKAWMCDEHTYQGSWMLWDYGDLLLAQTIAGDLECDDVGVVGDDFDGHEA